MAVPVRRRCTCGRLAFRRRWGRLPRHARTWLLALTCRQVYECYCGRVWAERQ